MFTDDGTSVPTDEDHGVDLDDGGTYEPDYGLYDYDDGETA